MVKFVELRRTAPESTNGMVAAVAGTTWQLAEFRITPGGATPRRAKWSSRPGQCQEICRPSISRYPNPYCQPRTTTGQATGACRASPADSGITMTMRRTDVIAVSATRFGLAEGGGHEQPQPQGGGDPQDGQLEMPGRRMGDGKSWARSNRRSCRSALKWPSRTTSPGSTEGLEQLRRIERRTLAGGGHTGQVAGGHDDDGLPAE